MSRNSPHRGSLCLVLLAVFVAAIGCATTRPLAAADSHRADKPALRTKTGLASYYAHERDGRRTASGETFDMQEMTAAHRTLPFGTRVRVTNLRNGRKAVVRINDRGPFRGHRILDVSYAAARKLGFASRGLARVRIEVI